MGRVLLSFSGFTSEFRGRRVDTSPLDLDKIQEISFMAMKPAGHYLLYVSKVGFYKLKWYGFIPMKI